jgi:hypothetical protein
MPILNFKDYLAVCIPLDSACFEHDWPTSERNAQVLGIRVSELVHVRVVGEFFELSPVRQNIRH